MASGKKLKQTLSVHFVHFLAHAPPPKKQNKELAKMKETLFVLSDYKHLYQC